MSLYYGKTTQIDILLYSHKIIISLSFTRRVFFVLYNLETTG
jgi:hypothetical protein